LPRLPDLTIHHAIDRIAHPGRAVVAEIVIKVLAVLGTSVLTQVGLQSKALRGRKIELLRLDGAVLMNIARKLVHPTHRQPVLEAPLQELEDQPRRVELESPEVVDLAAVFLRLHQDRVVPELEERVIARAEGQNENGKVLSRLGKRGPCRQDGPQRETQSEDISQTHRKRTYQVNPRPREEKLRTGGLLGR
jgi:hypothetical protein